MTEGYSQGIRFIVNLWQGGQLEEHLDHFLHLYFFRLTVAGNGLLDLQGSILEKVNAAPGGGKYNYPPRFTYLESGSDIFAKK